MSTTPLAVRTAGDPSMPVLCLLHGFMGSGADWEPFFDAFSEQAFVIAPDLPGHGRSTGRTEDAYTMNGAVAAVIRTLDAANVSRCTLVGYSMGGRVALSLAVADPDRVDALVLESASPGLAAPDARAARRAQDARRAERIRDDLRTFLGAWYRMPLFASYAQHGLVEDMVRRRLANDPVELATAIQGMSPGAQPPLWDALPTLNVPTHVLAGALDTKYVDLTARMAQRNAAFRRTVVPEAGHTIHAERPDAFHRLVLNALPD